MLENALISHLPKIIKGIRPKMKYAHQGGMNPPTIIIHGNHLTEVRKDYIRFLESFFRKSFDLIGSPLRIQLQNSDNPFDKEKVRPVKTIMKATKINGIFVILSRLFFINSLSNS